MGEMSGTPDWDLLTAGAAELGVSLDDSQVAALERYMDLLCEWNQRFNLTAIDSREEVLTKHFLDSLTCARAVDFATQRTLVDVGTGAGFPGLVLKIAYPHLQVTLLDAVRKRLGFLTHVAEELKLVGVEVLHARAEDVAMPARSDAKRQARPLPTTPALRERFDVVTARAVARLNVLAEWTLPFAKIGGRVIIMKGPDVKEEVAEAAHALSLLGGGPLDVLSLCLPGTEIGRSLVTVPKLKPTPPAYPRQSGAARKSPL
jgi:16S rRNA (guanine527-N7)-methyltransferase